MNWKQLPRLIIDTETTELDWTTGAVVELATIAFDVTGTKIGEYSTLVDIGRHIPDEATAIHGITDSDIVDAPCEDRVLRGMFSFVEDTLGSNPFVVAGYNCDFDHRMIAAMALRCGREIPEFMRTKNAKCQWIDALQWARTIQPFQRGKGQYKLAATAQRLGVEVSTSHRALGDCETTERVLRALIELDNGRLMPDDLDALLMRQQIDRCESEASFLKWLTKQPKAQDVQ